MDGAFDSELTRLMVGTLGWPKTLGFVGGDASGASARLSKLIL